MIPQDDGRLSIEFSDHYVIQPSHSFWNRKDYLSAHAGKPCADGFSYCSDTNKWRLQDPEIADLVAIVESDPSIDVTPTPTEPTFIVGG